MFFKKIAWFFKRHHFFYKMRFRLLSKSTNVKSIEKLDYNGLNKKETIPELFLEVNKSIFKDSDVKGDFEKAKLICLWLSENIKGGPGLSLASDKALEVMLNGKGGVCSDLAQVFNNFSVVNNIRVREWGSTRIPFDSSYGGHSFNEIYDKTLEKWILLDVSYCTFFTNSDDQPLSVSEFYEGVNRDVAVPVHFGENDENIEKSIEKNYFHPNNALFLIDNYSNRVYDKTINRFKKVMPVFLIHFGLFIVNKSYRYLFPFNDYRQIFSDKF